MKENRVEAAITKRGDYKEITREQAIQLYRVGQQVYVRDVFDNTLIPVDRMNVDRVLLERTSRPLAYYTGSDTIIPMLPHDVVVETALKHKRYEIAEYGTIDGIYCLVSRSETGTIEYEYRHTDCSLSESEALEEFVIRYSLGEYIVADHGREMVIRDPQRPKSLLLGSVGDHTGTVHTITVVAQDKTIDDIDKDIRKLRKKQEDIEAIIMSLVVELENKKRYQE